MLGQGLIKVKCWQANAIWLASFGLFGVVVCRNLGVAGLVWGEFCGLWFIKYKVACCRMKHTWFIVL